MPKYVKCPRCELNYILEGEELCDVCKAELHIGGVRLLEDDELDYNEEEGMLCPLCHTNFVEENEKYCAECLAKKNKIKDLSQEFGFAREVKEYKENPESFKGHVGDVSTVLRIAITKESMTPDLYEIMRLLGKDRMIKRISEI